MNIINSTGYELYNPSVIQARECTITDIQGRNFYDFEAGVWALPLGHNHPRINKAIINQLSCISHVGYRYSHPVVEEAAEALLKIMNLPNGKCVFLSSGSEAVEYAIKAVHKTMNRPYFLKLDKHYLSAYGLSGDLISERWISIDWQSYIEKAGDNNNNQCYNELLDMIPFDKINAFVFEPGNTSGTAKLPPKELITAIVSRVKAYDGYVIVDEVTTGMGRTGRWFGYEHYDIQPDVIACGKGLGNGYPISAVGFRKEIAAFVENANFLYAQSHQNDPLGCAVAKEVIEVIKEEKLLEKSTEQGEYLRAELMKLSAKHPCILEVRGVGLLCAMELTEEYRDKLNHLHRLLYERGFMVGVKPIAKVMRFYPPLNIRKTVIDQMIAALDEVLSL
ncbi:MAG TPA: aspartate aminotransferase family protein [Mobilitalea sp.]|nr:aspartate aminotransferase family protein [Mobilitalea sp.]